MLSTVRKMVAVVGRWMVHAAGAGDVEGASQKLLQQYMDTYKRLHAVLQAAVEGRDEQIVQLRKNNEELWDACKQLLGDLERSRHVGKLDDTALMDELLGAVPSGEFDLLVSALTRENPGLAEKLRARNDARQEPAVADRPS